MSEKTEIQKSLIRQNVVDKVTEEEFLSVLKLVAPGTNLRNAIDGALSTGKGALIVVGNDSLPPIMDGGFRINCRFTSQKLIELTKMDAAIILSKDLKRITHANVLLTPDSKIKTLETGTRHKAAERTARQINTLVVAISERKKRITLYYRNKSYILIPSEEILRKASEHIESLETQRTLFDNYLEKLNKSEIQNYQNVVLAITIIQKGKLIERIANDLKKFIVELGKESALIKIRLKEIKGGVEKETDLIIKDYTNLDLKKSKILLESLSYDEIFDDQNILSALVYEKASRTHPIKGWRILLKTCLNEAEIARIIKDLENLENILNADKDIFKSILGDEKLAERFDEELAKRKLNN